MWFTRISFCYLLTCCQGGLKTCFVLLSSLSISYSLLFQSRLYKSANNNYGWLKSRRVMSVSVLISSWFELQWSILPSHQILLRTDEIWPSYSIFLTFGWFSGWLVGWFGWLAGSYHLDSFPYCSPYLLNFHFKFDQNWMKIADFIAVRLVIIIEFSQKSVETLKPCKIQ